MSRSERVLRALLWPAGLVLGTLVLLAVAVALCGQSPARALPALFNGAFGSTYALSATAARAAVLALYALGVALSFRAGVINIGAEGQSRIAAAAVAAVAAGSLAQPLNALPGAGVAAALLAGGLAGAAWALLAGLLRAWRGVPDVIATLMLNLIALLLVRALLSSPALLREASIYPRSAPFAENARFEAWANTEFHSGVLLALPAVLLLHLLLEHTRFGFALRAGGLNPHAAAHAGHPVARLQLWSFALAGALAGLGGALGVLGRGRLDQEPAHPDFGYMAIAVALVAGLRPVWILPAALVFAGLDSGAKAMQATAGVPYWLVYLVEGVVVLAILVRGIRSFRRERPVSAAEASA